MTALSYYSAQLVVSRRFQDPSRNDKFRRVQNVNPNKLHDELIKAGIIPSLVESLNNTTWVTVEDSQHDAVMAIVAVHNPTPLLPPKTELELLKEQVATNQGAIDFIVMNF